MVRFRGQRSQHVLETMVCNSVMMLDAGLGHPVALNIAQCYKHLGTKLSLDEVCMQDARHKEKSALGAYSPIAVKIFGSRFVFDWVKLMLMRSLILSRLLFNVHIVVPSRAYTKRLSSVYMRVLRRITGNMRFDATAT